jgi:hypothetical protein
LLSKGSFNAGDFEADSLLIELGDLSISCVSLESLINTGKGISSLLESEYRLETLLALLSDFWRPSSELYWGS